MSSDRIVLSSRSLSIRRWLQCLLARHPSLYLWVLCRLMHGSLEKKVYLTLVREEDVVFDIGANQGYFTLLFSDIVGKMGEVHAFEPVPPTFSSLVEFLAQSGRFENTFLNKTACGDQKGSFVMQMPNGDSMQSALVRHASGSWKNANKVDAFQVETTPLDDYTKGGCEERLDFVKCDVEGAELLVIKGIRKRLLHLHPLLFLEVYEEWTKNFGYTAAELLQYLKSLGYDRFIAVTDRLSEISYSKVLTEGWGERESMNLLCAVGSLHASRLRCLGHFDPAFKRQPL